MNNLQLDPKSSFYQEKLQVTLSGKKGISPDSYIFTFEFEDPEQKLFENITTQHFSIYGQNLKGEVVTRKYTAISPVDQKGSFDVLIKIYRPNIQQLFLKGGELTPWLEQIENGTKIMIKRCIGKLLYLGKGKIILQPKLNSGITWYNKILMTCGGTGITPIYQLIQTIMADVEDLTEMFLLFANHTEADILLKQQLEQFAYSYPKKLKINYCLSHSNSNWNQFKGWVSLDMMKSVFPTPDQDTLAVLSGPKGMNKLVIKLYTQLGVHQDSILKF